MTELFLRLVSMSLSASWMALAVMLLRVLLKRVPRWMFPALWGLVAVRLVMPFSIKSHHSLIPKIPYVSDALTTAHDPTAQIPVGPSPSIGHAVIHDGTLSPENTSSSFTLQDILAIIWAAGVVLVLVYALVSYLKLHHRVAEAVRYQDNVYESEFVQSPFILGILQPRIYLPLGLDDPQRRHILAHESAHIRRLDHLWKPLGFLLLSVYWFAPVLWAAYVLLCRDIELACDEKVVRNMMPFERADYSQTLLDHSAGHRQTIACPLAFGEVGVRARVKNILSYKKPTFWVVLAAIISLIIVAACFLTDPVAVDLHLDRDPVAVAIGSDWRDNNAAAEAERDPQDPNTTPVRDTYLDDQHSQKLDRGDIMIITSYIQDLTNLKKTDKNIMLDCDYSVLLRTESGVCYTIATYEEGEDVYLATPDGTYVSHAPRLHHYVSYLFMTETEITICWYDPDLGDSPDDFPDTASLPEFPGVTFTFSSKTNGLGDVICAIETGDTEPRELIWGMPIENIYFTDLNGDGKRELCATVLYGSGLIDSRICVYDYANSTAYELSDRGQTDYALFHHYGLMVKETPTEKGSDRPIRTVRLVLTDAGLMIADPVSTETKPEDPPKTEDADPSMCGYPKLEDLAPGSEN